MLPPMPAESRPVSAPHGRGFLDYQKDPLADSWDAIVIGSGIGGLASAALLARHGKKRVLVLERHYVPGGFTHTFRRGAYEWDVGVHYVGEVENSKSVIRRAFDKITDGRLQWAPMPEVYDRIRIADREYEFPRGVNRLRARLKEYFPSEARAIDRYLALMTRTHKIKNLFMAEKGVPAPVAWLFGGMMRSPFLRAARRTTAEVLGEITQNRELIGLLTAQWGNFGLPPGQSSFGVHSIIAGHYLEGGFYPVGGSARIASLIAPVIEHHGGRIVVRAEAAEILLENNQAAGVRMANGRVFRSPLVVSDIGAHKTFLRMLPQANPTVAGIESQLRAIPPTMGHLCLYVGLKQSAASLGLTGTNLWVYPNCEHDANVARVASDPRAPFSVLYISFPSAKDPEFHQRHPDLATVEVLTLVPYGWFSQWQDTAWKRRGETYDGFKAELASRLQAELERNVPALAGKIDHAELSTPLSTRHFAGCEHGEAYGLSASPQRFQLRCLSPRTPLRGVFLTGQDISCTGVAGALMGGVLAASAMLNRPLV